MSVCKRNKVQRRLDLAAVKRAMMLYPDDTKMQMRAVSDRCMSESTFYARRRTIINRNRRSRLVAERLIVVQAMMDHPTSYLTQLEVSGLDPEPFRVRREEVLTALGRVDQPFVPVQVSPSIQGVLTMLSITRPDFDANATVAQGTAIFDQTDFVVRGMKNPKKGGKVGWYGGGKVPVDLGGNLVMCQVSANITVQGDLSDGVKNAFTATAKPEHASKILKGLPLVVRGTDTPFSTGSLGWFCGGRTAVILGQHKYKVSVSASIVVIGSSDKTAVPKDQDKPEETDDTPALVLDEEQKQAA